MSLLKCSFCSLLVVLSLTLVMTFGVVHPAADDNGNRQPVARISR